MAARCGGRESVRLWRVFLLLIIGALCILPLARCVAHAEALPNPPGLRKQVEFWKKIFAHVSVYEVVVHDVWELDRVYATLDFSSARDELGGDILPAFSQIRVDQEKDRIRSLLLRLHEQGGRPQPWNEEEQRIARLFASDPNPQKFLLAADPARIRAQRGLREKFYEGLKISRRYLPEMERIFRAEGVPVEITRLPLVESAFNVRAYSKAGAAGIWQFIPSTARLFMRVDDVIDERRDPIIATRAAAAFLKRNYDQLGSWPLAITAYNHGPAGVRRAVETLGTRDIVEIVRRYRGPKFGFASRNFYAEFLAALAVDRDHQQYFGPIQFERPRESASVVLRRSAPFPALARAAGMEPTELAEWNLALTPAVVAGKLPVPRGYALQLPAPVVAGFQRRLEAWESEQQRQAVAAARQSTQRKAQREPAKVAEPVRRKHRVRRGETLVEIARLYGTSPEKIRQKNRLKRGARLQAGQVLVIPEG